ncbi:kelch-like protein 10 [Nephila pilipes]|uniref:Kelch-like protein diablo n=1 Tax=Nephila pilipes TaxID=299642 RepID=A0A8X6UTP2_NEPPI|nr:kelch-like protein 10 [Nephila pilipes]
MSNTIEDTNYAEGALHSLNSMRLLGHGCDAILSTEDGGMFRIHKSVMSWCSTYFRTVFTTSLVNTDCGDGPLVRTFIIIPNISSSMLEVIIQYAYSGVTLVSEENVELLLPAADQFNVLGMVKECTEFLVNKLEPGNCLGIWKFAKEYFVFELERETFKYILDHFLEITEKSAEYLELSLFDLKSILKEDSLNVEREILIWESVKRWIHHDAPKRQHHIYGLLKYMRLAVMPIKEFQDLMNDPIVFKCVQCWPYVSQVAKFILKDLRQFLQPNEKRKENLLFMPRLPRQILFCFGGWSMRGPTNTIHTYDCRVDSWKQVEIEESIGNRVYHQCISLGKYIYIIGGSDGFASLNSCYRFDTETKKYEEIAPLHEHRCFLSAVELDNKIYAIGGFGGYLERSETAECFTSENNQWTYIASMSGKRSDASACCLDNRIFIAGGFDGSVYLQSAEVYYVEFNQWCILPAMNSCRSGLGCVAIGDYIYAIGGCDGDIRLQTVEKYDVASKQWYATKPMKKPRSNFAIERPPVEGALYARDGKG